MKKKPENATIEEILADITSYEDIDAALIVSRTQEKGVFIMSYEGDIEATGSTMKEALINFRKKEFERPQWMRENEEEDLCDLDWSDYYE